MMFVLYSAITTAIAAPAFFDQGFVLKAPESGAFAGGVNAPTVDIENATNTYVMYFESSVSAVSADCVSSYVIGRATSRDGLAWTLDDAPVLGPDSTSDASRCSVSQPAIVFDGTTWHLFYSTAREKPSSGAAYNLPTGIAYATSTDGQNFTVQAAPLIPTTDLSETVGLSSATIVNGQIYVVYFYNNDFRLATAPLSDPSVWATSTDAVVDHLALEWAANDVISPALFCEDDMDAPLSLVFAGDSAGERSLAFATSTDGNAWTMDEQTPLTGGDLTYSELNHWDVIEAGPDYLMWYGKTDAATGLKAIGLAATASPWSPAQPRLCPHAYQTDPPDTGDTGDTSSDDSVNAGDATGGKTTGPCGCASAGDGAAGSLVGLAMMVLSRRRSRA